MGHLSISVALCTYNGAQYIQEQLESFAAQSMLPDELVVCDDGQISNGRDDKRDPRIVNPGLGNGKGKVLVACPEGHCCTRRDVILEQHIETTPPAQTPLLPSRKADRLPQGSSSGTQRRIDYFGIRKNRAGPGCGREHLLNAFQLFRMPDIILIRQEDHIAGATAYCILEVLGRPKIILIGPYTDGELRLACERAHDLSGPIRRTVGG